MDIDELCESILEEHDVEQALLLDKESCLRLYIDLIKKSHELATYVKD